MFGLGGVNMHCAWWINQYTDFVSNFYIKSTGHYIYIYIYPCAQVFVLISLSVRQNVFIHPVFKLWRESLHNRFEWFTEK